MTLSFPKQDFYSNGKVKIEKNLIKRLCRLRDEKDKITNCLYGIRNQCKPLFERLELELNHNFKDITTRFSENVRTIYSSSYNTYPNNQFKRTVKVGACEACNKRRKLEQAHIIKKSAFNRPYNKWFFLKYHPVNILFLCHDCHTKFDDKYRNNFFEKVSLSKSHLSRVERVMRKRVRKIKKAITADERYVHDYGSKIRKFNDNKRRLLKSLLRSFR